MSDWSQQVRYIRIPFLKFVSEVKRSGYETYELYTKSEDNFKEFIKELSDAGLDEVMITCDADNIASKQIINKFDAEYMKTFVDKESGKDVLQFRVLTS